jgi:hypothetical protein
MSFGKIQKKKQLPRALIKSSHGVSNTTMGSHEHGVSLALLKPIHGFSQALVNMVKYIHVSHDTGKMPPNYPLSKIHPWCLQFCFIIAMGFLPGKCAH